MTLDLPDNPTHAIDGLLNRYSDLREDTDWIRQQLESDRSRFIVVSEGELLIINDEQGIRLHYQTLDQIIDVLDRYAFLGIGEGVSYFSVGICSQHRERFTSDPETGFAARSAMLSLSGREVDLSLYARALEVWWRTHQFCQRCGSPNTLDTAGFRMLCSKDTCAHAQFPRLEPAIIVLTEHQGRCLLGRQPKWPTGMYSTLAGFVEPGETIEQAVVREVEEESGVQIDRVHYHSSQAWPFPASLMLGFYAHAADPVIRCGPELEDARWFDIDGLKQSVMSGEVKLPTQVSISCRLLSGWAEDRHGERIDEWVRG